MFHFFIESRNDKTPEFSFVKCYVDKILPGLDYDIIPMNGIGNSVYQVPNLKGKLHTYINAVPMEKKLRNSLGSGNWQFQNSDYWDLDCEYLNPLKIFLESL